MFVFVDLDVDTGEFFFVGDFEISENGEYEGISFVEDVNSCLKINDYSEAISIISDSGFHHLAIKKLV